MNRLLGAREDEWIRASEGYPQQIFDAMFALIGLFSTDGLVLDINRALIEAGGVQRDDVLGRPFADTHWWSHSREAGARITDVLRRAALGETVREELVAAAIGEHLLVVDWTFSPLRDASGRVTHVLGFGVDITERRGAERALRASEGRLRTIIETEPECVKVIGRDGRLLEMNPAGLAMLEAASLEDVQ